MSLIPSAPFPLTRASLPAPSAQVLPGSESFFQLPRRIKLDRNRRTNSWLYSVAMTGFYGAVEAGSELPVLSTLHTGRGSHREPLHPSSLLRFHWYKTVRAVIS